MKRMTLAAACAAAAVLSGCAGLSPGGGLSTKPFTDLGPKDVKNIRVRVDWEDPRGTHTKEFMFRQSEVPPTNAPAPVVTNPPPVVVTNVPPPIVTNAANADAVDATGARIASKHRHTPAKIPVAATLNSARPEGSNVRLSFSGLDSWSHKSGEKTTDGGVCILWRDADGVLTGGWFDHHGVGQTVKTMNNIPGGYLDGKQPPPGADVWFYLVNYEFTKRTNVKAGGKWNTFKLPAGFKLPND